jgi:hypothetical protein
MYANTEYILPGRDAARANPIDFFPFAEGKVLPAAEQDKIAMSIYAQLSHEITHAFPSKDFFFCVSIVYCRI